MEIFKPCLPSDVKKSLVYKGKSKWLSLLSGCPGTITRAGGAPSATMVTSPVTRVTFTGHTQPSTKHPSTGRRENSSPAVSQLWLHPSLQ